MANLDAPNGFKALTNPAGTSPRLRPYRAVASEVGKNAIVALTAAGLVTEATLTTTVTNLLGVANNRVAAGTAGAADREVYVYDDPSQEFVAQTDDATVTALTDYLGRNFAYTGNGATNAFNESTGEIDGNTGSVTNNSTTIRPLKCTGLYDAINNELGANTRLVVKINPRNHIWANDVGV